MGGLHIDMWEEGRITYRDVGGGGGMITYRDVGEGGGRIIYIDMGEEWNITCGSVSTGQILAIFCQFLPMVISERS